MKFTGERYIPTEQGRIRLEHYHRYAIALDVVKGKDVLDVACGEGYGSFLMADAARSVVGVDISNEIIEYAAAAYKKSNLEFHQGCAFNLDFEDALFDVVVSFETIEHLAEQEQMLAEIRRVLRPDGVLVISSPNRPVYAEDSGVHNKFHVKELDFNEFDELLKTRFPAIQYFGQRMLMASVIQPLAGEQNSVRVWHDDGKDLKPNAGHLVDPVYFVALCGANSADLSGIDMSIIYPDKLDLIKHYMGFAKWGKTLDSVVADRNEQITYLNQVLAERDMQIAAMYNSTSWLITRPLRAVKQLIKPAKPEVPTGEEAISTEQEQLPTGENAISSEQQELPADEDAIGSEHQHKYKEKPVVLLHHHIFKNAGSTLDYVLKKNFGVNFAQFDTDSSVGRITPELLQKFLDEHENIKAISSHHFHCREFKSEAHVFLDIILLRHPMDRLRSMYDFYRYSEAIINDPLWESAQNMTLGEFLEYLLEHHRYAVNDVQVTILGCNGKYSEPNQDDLSVAYNRMRKAFILGNVELFDESLVAAEFFLHPVFGKLDLSYKAHNVSANRAESLEDRLEEMRARCGSELYEQLLAMNEFDLKLLEYAKQEVLHRVKFVPNYDIKLAEFRDRCLG